ncbi:hypothetical protein R77569_02566 [Ralstonia mannitolilytica]|uniref:Uncharacterized protein n=1 Tax=Ralstonia mannitolilytica TaxID=105219 RepID=A0ABM9KPR7_9RALS|nr:hypothetical protein [Ralstonia mannitolilytica]CAJ0873876.1 hypothetical protein R77569_02566 [Ralstonia mannitolilytica]
MHEWPAPGLTLRTDGIFVVEPDDDAGHTPEELAALTEHPTNGGFSEAALKLPCTVQELADFLRWAGCEDYIRSAQHGFVELLLPALENAELTAEYEATRIGPQPNETAQVRQKFQLPNLQSPTEEACPPSTGAANLNGAMIAREAAQQNGKTIHVPRTRRRHALGHVIGKAKHAANEPDNYLSVWPELMRLAEQDEPPAPLLGYVDGEGVKYQTDNGIKFFTKDALRKQMNPNAR